MAVETVLLDAETARTWMRDVSDLAAIRGHWRAVHDYGGTFTTPRERLTAGERLRELLDS